MGDLIGESVTGSLYHVPKSEFERVLVVENSICRAELFADLCRVNTLYMIARAGSGHIGSSFSSMDIMTWLHLNVLGIQKDDFGNSKNTDIFFSSKGHDAPGLYNIWIGLGKLDYKLIHKLRKFDGLPGHPDVSIPNVITNTGSLGMGISKAKGMIFANRLLNKRSNVYVLTGDGELQEGQFWESMVSAVNDKLHELTVIIDHNKLQSDTLVTKVSDLGDLHAKLSAFGWHVSRCNGNSMSEIEEVLNQTKLITDKPKVVIADTIKGKGVSFMEHTSIDSDVENYKFHSGAPSELLYSKGVNELIAKLNHKLKTLFLSELKLEIVTQQESIPLLNPNRLIGAYSNALLNQAKNNNSIVALDADLVIDTGLNDFKREFSDRFIECGIAEQDMVSQAGGMALMGLIPIVHSFACFLSSRPNEQIYNNCTENKKVIYVGSLAGMLPGGPGHSHQSLRDIASLGSIPNLTLLEPCCESEVSKVLDWAINVNNSSTYIRLVSIPWELRFKLPSYSLEIGKGVVLQEGKEVVVISYGPIMLSQAILASQTLNEEFGISVRVVNLPWLNCVDHIWIKSIVEGFKLLVSIENHNSIGGQGDRISEALTINGINNIRFKKIALKGIPQFGTNEEVLKAHSYDVPSIVKFISESMI